MYLYFTETKLRPVIKLHRIKIGKIKLKLITQSKTFNSVKYDFKCDRVNPQKIFL